MKKKILCSLLAFALCLSASACAESASGADINISDTNSSESIFSQTAEDTSEDVTVPAQTVTAEENVTEPEDLTTEAEQTSDSSSQGTSGTSQTVQTTPAQTAATVPAVTQPPAPQWSETAASGTMYINTNGVYSRISAIQGSTKVKSYSLNQAVTVIAKTDTGYYKIGDGEYIHGDYLSTSKVTAAVTTTPKPPVTTTTTKPPAVTTTTTTTAAATKPPVVTTTPGGTTPDYGQRPQTQEEINFANRVFDLTNAERAKAGLEPFKKMDTVTQVANVRAWELTEIFSHSRPDGRSFTSAFNEKGLIYGWFGENIAAGQSTPEEVVQAWMNSPTHRDNILSDYEYMGVGYYKVPGTLYTYHWVQNFYTPQS